MMVRINLALLAAVVISALALIASQHQSRRLYNELQNEQAQAKRHEEDIARLQIEQSFWSTPTRIEQVAREKLAMRLPDGPHTRILAGEAAEVRDDGAAMKVSR